jgi:hypothetical protein
MNHSHRRAAASLLLSLAALGAPSVGLAGDAVVTPLVAKGIDPLVSLNMTSLISSEIDFMGAYDNVDQMTKVPTGLNGACLNSASCLGGIAKAEGAQAVITGALAQVGNKYDFFLVLYDNGRIVRKKEFTLPNVPSVIADSMGGHVRELITGEKPADQNTGAAAVVDAGAFDDGFEDDEMAIIAPVGGGNSRRIPTGGGASDRGGDLEDFDLDADPEDDARRQREEREARERAEQEEEDRRKAAALAAQREEDERRAREERERQAREERERQAREEDERRKAAAVAAKREEDDRRRREEEAAAAAASAPAEDDEDDFDFSFGGGVSVVEEDDSSSSSRGAAVVEDDPPSRDRYADVEDDDPPPRRTTPSRYDDLEDEPRDRSKDRRADLDDGPARVKQPREKKSSDASDVRASIALRGGYSRFQQLNFFTYGAEASFMATPNFAIIAGAEAYSTRRVIPFDELEEGQAAEQWNTILPLNGGGLYKFGTSNVRPYVGGDVVIIPGVVKDEGGVAIGLRARGGADFHVTDVFGFNLNVSAGMWSGQQFQSIQDGFGNTGIVPQFSAGTIFLF